jgi:hypothetical protein
MKKNFWKFLTLFLVSVSVLVAARITTNLFKIGNKTAENIDIEFDIGNGTTNPKIRWDNSGSALSFSDNGTSFKDFDAAGAPQGEIVVFGGGTNPSGTGTTDTNIRQFNATTTVETGTSISVVTNAANGTVFTINQDGVYSMMVYDVSSNTAAHIGISRNSTQLTTNIESITAADRLAIVYESNVSGAGPMTTSVTRRLDAGDEIRAHYTSGMSLFAGGSTNKVGFSIVQVSPL